jgi:DNA polymerase III subunit delta'
MGATMKTNTSNKSWPHIGNRHISDFLSRILAKSEAAGSYIFAGPEGLGKATTAKHFARLLLCTDTSRKDMAAVCGVCRTCTSFDKGALHSDLVVMESQPGKRLIGVDQARDFISRLNQSSFTNLYNVGIVKDSEELTEGASNALLKTLEEPKRKAVIILTASSLDRLPATIVSRSRLLRFNPVSFSSTYDYLIEKYRIPRDLAKDIARRSFGRPALAARLAEDSELLKARTTAARGFISMAGEPVYARFARVEEALAHAGGRGADGVLDDWISAARDLLLADCGLYDLAANQSLGPELKRAQRMLGSARIKELFSLLDRAREYMKANVAPRTALGHVAVNM